ncbi:MAG: hypothetical protein CL609_05630 [Anaerolineaceae bacterium]|nr:hypothetical protein [Anaerolineaceae bacterium]
MNVNHKSIAVKSFLLAIGLFFIIGLGGCAPNGNLLREPKETNQALQPLAISPTALPSPTSTHTQTLTPTIEVTPTPSINIGSTKTSPVDGMELMYVPAGNFTMGSDRETNEKPAHEVTLDAFWIDKFEVTNAQFQNCVKDGNCDPPKSLKYFNKEEYQNHPVVFVNWYQANNYCQWAGRRLPTEAEWEMAARGPNSWIYPWGDDKPNEDQANYNQNKDNESGSSAVGSFPNGMSIFGVMDLAGNVYEWVNDWYAEDYYSSDTTWINPQGPTDGDKKVLRGGSLIDNQYALRSANRDGYPPEGSPGVGLLEEFFGFRCAESISTP